MNHLIKALACVMCVSLLGFAQIDNVQFQDMEGNSYDLYELLDAGKYVLCHFTFNG